MVEQAQKPLVLLAEHDPGVRARVTALLEDAGFEVAAAVVGRRPDIVLVDSALDLPLLGPNDPPVLLLTSEPQDARVDDAIAAGAVGYLRKPASLAR